MKITKDEMLAKAVEFRRLETDKDNIQWLDAIINYIRRSVIVPDDVTDLNEDIRQDGSVPSKTKTATQYIECERVELRKGYLAVIMECGDIDHETRVPLAGIKQLLETPLPAAPKPEDV